MALKFGTSSSSLPRLGLGLGLVAGPGLSPSRSFKLGHGNIAFQVSLSILKVIIRH